MPLSDPVPFDSFTFARFEPSWGGAEVTARIANGMMADLANFLTGANVYGPAGDPRPRRRVTWTGRA